MSDFVAAELGFLTSQEHPRSVLCAVKDVGSVDMLGIRLPIYFANFYQIVQSTSGTESYSEGFTLIASILHKIVSSTVSEQT